MKPYLLKENNWNNVKVQDYKLAVLPWGATEAHNYHLPYGTDIYEAEFIAEKCAEFVWEKGKKIIVLPAIPYGVNTGQKEIFLDININPSTQLAILSDILSVLEYQGIYKFGIINSHGGNEFKSILRELGNKFPKMFLFVVDWYKIPGKEKFFSTPGDHADEMETSLMLHLCPELILPRDKWGEGKEKKNIISEFSENWVWTERKWDKISEDTGIGNPTEANEEKGKEFFDFVTIKVSDLLVKICDTEIDKLYK